MKKKFILRKNLSVYYFSLAYVRRLYLSKVDMSNSLLLSGFTGVLQIDNHAILKH